MFVKIYGDKLISSSLWDERPEARLVFLSMLALADGDGVVDVPNTRALARILNLTEEFLLAGLAVLEAPDSGSRTPDEDGRRVVREGASWRMVNYEKYREFRTATQEATRRRVAAHRKNKPAVTSNSGNGGVTAVTPALDLSLRSDPDPDRVRPEATEANRWLTAFCAAWRVSRDAAMYTGGPGASKATAVLADEIANLSAESRASAWARRAEMFAAFFADEKNKQAGFRFSWFVQRFEGLRKPSREPGRMNAQEAQDELTRRILARENAR